MSTATRKVLATSPLVNQSLPQRKRTRRRTNTKLVLFVPLVTYYLAVSGYRAATHGVLPDRPICCTIEELLAGTDKELGLALELARK